MGCFTIPPAFCVPWAAGMKYSWDKRTAFPWLHILGQSSAVTARWRLLSADPGPIPAGCGAPAAWAGL